MLLTWYALTTFEVSYRHYYRLCCRHDLRLYVVVYLGMFLLFFEKKKMKKKDKKIQRIIPNLRKDMQKSAT